MLLYYTKYNRKRSTPHDVFQVKNEERKTMPEKTISAKKKSFTMPHTFVILFIIIAIAVALT